MIMHCPVSYLLMVLFVSWTTSANVDVRLRRQTKKTACVTSSGTDGTCVPYRQCSSDGSSSGSRKPIRPTECWWETDGPVICCPKPPKLTSLPTAKPAPPPVHRIRSTCGTSPVIPVANAGRVLLKRQLFQQRDLIKIQVVGGENATPDRWPWMGLIFSTEDKDRVRPLCGASLISDQTLLTAAHCFIGRSSTELVIRLGEHNLKNRNNGRQRVEMKIRKVIQHEEFHFPSLYNDLALVLLETKVILSTNIQPVCLPENLKNENFAGKNATVTGWGLLKFGGKQADILQELQLPVLTNEECQKKYDSISGLEVNLPQGIVSTMMCAGFEKEVKDSCQGDSGGPLVYEQSPRTWSQIGIVSAGYDCGSGFPGLYTRVTSYLDWIKDKMI